MGSGTHNKLTTLKTKVFWGLPYSARYHLNKTWNKSTFQRNQQIRKTQVNGDASSLYGFDTLKCIYVHIPKTAGVSINKALFNNLGGIHRKIKDYSLIFNKREFYSYYKFCFVRNPYERIASAYFFLKKGGMHKNDHKWFEENISQYSSFNDFVKEWINEKNIYKQIHFIPQFEFITINGKIMVDDFYKFEEMDKGFEEITKKLKLKNRTLPVLNKSSRNKINYLEYYNEISIEKINKVYNKDFRLFEYQ